MQAYEITVDGCASGLGLGLDSINRVTILKPGGPADACGLIAVGDRIVNVDGEPLNGLQLQQVLRPADRHVFVLEVGQMAASPLGIGTQPPLADGAAAAAAAAAAASHEESRRRAVAAYENPQDPALAMSPDEPPEPLPGPPPEPLPPPLPPSRAALFASLMQKVRAAILCGRGGSCSLMHVHMTVGLRICACHIPQAIDHRLAVLQSYVDDPAKDPDMHMASVTPSPALPSTPTPATTTTTSTSTSSTSSTAFTTFTIAPTLSHPTHPLAPSSRVL